MKTLVYRVNLNYVRFDFDDHNTADHFAALAKSKYSGGFYDKKMNVSVDYLTKDEAEKAQEGNE